MSVTRSRLVDEVLGGLPEWQRETCARVRELVHDAEPEGQGNATARAVQIRPGDVLNEAAFKDLIAAVVANNRAGGWRRLG